MNAMNPSTRCRRPGFALLCLVAPAAALAGDAPGATGTLAIAAYGNYVELVLSVPAEVIPPALHGLTPAKGRAGAPPYFYQLGGGDGFVHFPPEASCHSDGDWVMRIDAAPSLVPDLGSQTGNDGPLPGVPPAGRWLVGAYQFHCIGRLKAEAVPWIRLDVFDLLPALTAVSAEMPARAPGVVQQLTPSQREFRVPAAGRD